MENSPAGNVIVLFFFFSTVLQNLHTELERCEPRVVSLLEAADWLRQANEKTGAVRARATTASDQTIADSHARLSHLRARLTALIEMTAGYASELGTVLGYDMSPESACTRLHQVNGLFRRRMQNKLKKKTP